MHLCIQLGKRKKRLDKARIFLYTCVYMSKMLLWLQDGVLKNLEDSWLRPLSSDGTSLRGSELWERAGFVRLEQRER